MNSTTLATVGAMVALLGQGPLECQGAVIAVHTVETEYQNGKQEIRVLVPDTYDKSKRYRVLYVLPVEVGFEARFGYALGELKEMDAQNLYDLASHKF